MMSTAGAAAGRRTPVNPSFRGGEGTPLVLLHGLAMSWRAWRPVLSPLTAAHDVFAPTLPGHRGGPPLPDRGEVRSLADALERTLDAAGIDTAHIAGNSMGGWLALELARRGRADRVTAFAPAGVWSSPWDLRRLQVAAAAVRATMGTAFPNVYTLTPRARRLLLRGLMEHGDRLTPAQAREVLRDIRGCAMVREVYRTARRQSPLEAFDACPVHIVWGLKDRTLPYRRYGRPMLRLLPAARKTVLPGAGHVPMYDEPAEVVRLLLGPAVDPDGAAAGAPGR